MINLGCIADDFTGATDLASSLRRGGARVELLLDDRWHGVRPEVDVLVVALKSRSEPPEQAVEHSLAALRSLEALGVPRFFFKYCSTFDSTARGNIGPVLDALSDHLKVCATIVCPAHPEQGRTVYHGHLFVGDQLLAESPMAHHPVNPMRDSDLRRLLGGQTNRAVGLLPYEIVAQGPSAIRAEFERLAGTGCSYLIADALERSHLSALAAAFEDLPFLSGGAGLGAAIGGPRSAFAIAELLAPHGARGPVAVLVGSNSHATRRQIDWVRNKVPTLKLEPLALAEDGHELEEIIGWADAHLDSAGFVIYTSDELAAVARNQHLLGAEATSALIESALAAVARHLVDRGVRRFLVAGGETSGAIVRALGLSALEVGEDLEAGIPWMRSHDSELELALKSGNFGDEALFEKAIGATR